MWPIFATLKVNNVDIGRNMTCRDGIGKLIRLIQLLKYEIACKP